MDDQLANPEAAGQNRRRWTIAAATVLSCAILPLLGFAVYEALRPAPKATAKAGPKSELLVVPGTVVPRGAATASSETNSTPNPPAQSNTAAESPPAAPSSGPSAVSGPAAQPPQPASLDRPSGAPPAAGGRVPSPHAPAVQLAEKPPTPSSEPKVPPREPSGPPGAPATPQPAPAPSVQGSTVQANGSQANRSTQQIVEQVEPSIVVVEVTLEKGKGQGSGFLLDAQGTFVTNYHVIEGAKSVQVKFRDKSTAAVPGYLAILPGKDLAILRCEAQNRRLQPLPLAAAQPAKGETVLTFGAPLGFGATVSDGIVSAVRSGSDVSEIMKGASDIDVYAKSMGYDLDAVWVQITAPISPGNSGGPLVNMKGEVLGLNTWCLRSGQNLNFAISGQHIKTLLTAANSGNHLFTELPKPREGHEVAALGDADKTWAFWHELGQINRALHNRVKSTKRPPVPKTQAKSKSFFAKMENFYKDLAEISTSTAKRIKALDQAGVDGELIGVATVDAVCLDELAEAFRSAAIDAEIGSKVTIYDSARLSTKAYGKYRESEIKVAYEILRLALSARYEKQFPNILGDAYKGEAAAKTKGNDDEAEGDDADAGGDPETEKKAARSLALAKQLLKSKPERAKEKLAKLIADFPGTKAAEEAKGLLEEMGPK